jgi:anti-anti-sigma factor
MEGAMFETQTTMTVRKINAQASVIDIHGEITAFTCDRLRAAYAQASANETPMIILNFTDLDYMNSTGISVLITMLAQARRQQQHLLAFGLNKHYQKILRLTGLSHMIGMYDSETEALAAVNMFEMIC